MKGGEKRDKDTVKESTTTGDRAASTQNVKTVVIETKEEHEMEVELNSILKKGPSQYTPIPLSVWCDALAGNLKLQV